MLRDADSRRIFHRVAGSISGIVSVGEKPAVIAVDIPIGLLEYAVSGGRLCDQPARALLGATRASNVFTPPARPALSGQIYEEACGASHPLT